MAYLFRLSGDSIQQLRDGLARYENTLLRPHTSNISDETLDRAYHRLGITQKRHVRAFTNGRHTEAIEAAMTRFREHVREIIRG